MNHEFDNKALGWSSAIESQFQTLASGIEGAVAARIVRENRGQYAAISEGERYSADITGAYRHAHGRSEEFPAVGDWVVATIIEGEGKLRIHKLLPRQMAFVRSSAGSTSDTQVVAANVTSVFIVVGLDGDFNLRRIERYVALAYESGAQPVIVLNKSDLVDDLTPYVAEIESVAIGVPVHPVSSIENQGVEALAPYLGTGQTVACLGSSGVGKSTLINALVGESLMDTGAVREDDSRGRHTTTYRQLILLPEGGALIDTPGMRELQLTGDEESLNAAFSDIEALIEGCRFRDCNHNQEPGCAVREAIERGELESSRYASYQKLQRELDYSRRRESESYDHEERKRMKEFGKMVKRVMNEKKNRR